MVSATKDGESLICRMLTSTCPRLGDIVDDGAYVNTAICDRGWRSILEAISERIRILIAERDSVEVGFSSSKRIHTHLETLTHALTFAKDMIISHIRQMQRCVIPTMAMIDRDDRDVKIRVRLLRLLNARESEMCGVWRGALLPTRVPDLWLRRARRNEGVWISFLWLSDVENIALARGVAPIMKLVVAAVRSGGDAVREPVKRFVERVGDRGGGRG